MSAEGSLPTDLRGSILAAHPSLTDPHFRRALIFLAEHSPEGGALGYILNRPLGSSMELPMSEPPLSVDLYYGGPVQPKTLTLASLQWRAEQSLAVFHTFRADDVESTRAWISGLRAFAGCAGWSPGQLEQELRQKSWLVLAPSQRLIEAKNPEALWRDVMRHASPLLALLSSAPEDPSLN